MMDQRLIMNWRACTWRSAVLGACVAVSAVGLTVSASASAESLAVQIRSAGLHAAGAGAAVEIKARCAPDAVEGGVLVEVSQASSGGQDATGFGSASVPCTGSTVTVLVGVMADAFSPGAPFSLGPADFSARLGVCTESGGCSSTSAARSLRIRADGLADPAYDSTLIDIKLSRRGEVRAGGARTVVEVTYSCQPAVDTFVFAKLGQVDDPVNVDEATLAMTCDGERRSGVIVFRAGGADWTTGSAFLSLNGDACTETACTAAYAFRTIRIR